MNIPTESEYDKFRRVVALVGASLETTTEYVRSMEKASYGAETHRNSPIDNVPWFH